MVKFQVSGPAGRNRQLEWEYGQLWFREDPASADGLYRRPWKPFIEPAWPSWERLYRALESSGFWEWPKDSRSPGTTAAGCWSLAVRWGSRSRKVAGMTALPPAFEPLAEALAALPTQEVQGYPSAFHLQCEWPDGEEHYGWDGRLLSFAAYLPKPRIVEGLQVPAEAWKGIIPLLEEAALSPTADCAKAMHGHRLFEPPTPAVHSLLYRSHSPHCIELRNVLRKLIPTDRRR
jgi:hypothetical protein